jgi:hypothetical protein
MNALHGEGDVLALRVSSGNNRAHAAEESAKSRRREMAPLGGGEGALPKG